MQGKNSNKVKSILLSIADHLNVGGIKGLADELGVSKGKLYGWIRNGKIADPGLILTRYPYISAKWLFDGTGPMMVVDESTTKSKKEMNITGDKNIQSGENTGPRNFRVVGGGKETLTLSTDEQYLIESIRKLQRQDEILQDLIFRVLQHHREQKKEDD